MLVSVSGSNSSAGAAPAIISPPTAVLDLCVTNTGMQGFNERQGVKTMVAHVTDLGTIPAGTWVNSHMIFLNPPSGEVSHRFVTWTFEFPVIGVMSDRDGSLEAASTGELGAPGTNYTGGISECGPAAPFQFRGLDTASVSPAISIDPNTGCTQNTKDDGYLVSGNTITVCMWASTPGDWMRVLTHGLRVAIDVKPGSFPNCFNVNGSGVIPVAILGNAGFDVNEVNPNSLLFGGLAVRVRGNGQPQCSVQDTNADGFPDLVCQFVDDPADWTPGDGTADLTGQLHDGTPIKGTDSICIRP